MSFPSTPSPGASRDSQSIAHHLRSTYRCLKDQGQLPESSERRRRLVRVGRAAHDLAADEGSRPAQQTIRRVARRFADREEFLRVLEMDLDRRECERRSRPGSVRCSHSREARGAKTSSHSGSRRNAKRGSPASKEDSEPHSAERQRFSANVRREAVAAVKAGEPRASVAQRYGVKLNTLHKWAQRADKRDAALTDARLAGYLDKPDLEALYELHYRECRCNGSHINDGRGNCFKCARSIGVGIPLQEEPSKGDNFIPSRVPLRIRDRGRWITVEDWS